MKKMTLKTILTLAALALLLTFTVSGTLAYIATETGPVENVFQPVHVTVDVDDTVTDGKKHDVVITNTSNIPAYIRAAIVGYWCKNIDGKQMVVADWNPEDEDQGKFAGLTGSGWVESGDYYYFTTPVAAGQPTGTPLFTTYTVGKAPIDEEGVYLVMDILAQAVQSEPKDAVKDLWGDSVASLLN